MQRALVRVQTDGEFYPIAKRAGGKGRVIATDIDQEIWALCATKGGHSLQFRFGFVGLVGVVVGIVRPHTFSRVLRY